MVTGLVLAAGGSKRLGQPKQLLPYGSATLLDHVLDTARSCHFDQLLCVIGGDAEAVRAGVDLEGAQVVENPQFGEGCSSSIAAAPDAVDPRCEVLVLMLGDKAVWKLLDHHADAAVDVPVAGTIPPDVDTWEDYEALRA